MTDNNTRKGTREKKIPKHLHFEQTQYGPFVHAKTNESKEKISITLEKNFLANALCKFVQNTNQKYRNFMNGQISHKMFQKIHSSEIEQNLELYPRFNQARQNLKENDIFSTWKDKEPKKMSTTQGRKCKTQQKLSISQNLQKQGDWDYNNLLCEHIRQTFPNISNISPGTLKTFDLPRHLIENSHFNKPKIILQKPKKQRSLEVNNVNSCSVKNEESNLLFFKRQAYHLTIAYYIHAKKQKDATFINGQQMDPTFNARIKREQVNFKGKERSFNQRLTNNE